MTKSTESTSSKRTRPFAITALGTVLLIGGGSMTALSRADAGTLDRQCVLSNLESNEKVSLAITSGRLTYVDFWASWCGPCKLSFPFMNQLVRQFESQGLNIVAISVDKDPADARAFVRSNPAAFTIAHDSNGQCARTFGVKGMPSSFIVSKSGDVLYAHTGFRPSDREEITRQVRTLIEKAKE